MHHLKRQNKIHDSPQEKRDLSQAMHHFHAIAPIILLLHKWHPEKGPITPSRPTPLSHHHDKFFAVYEPLPETRANYTITPIALGTSFIFALIFQRKEYFKTRFLWTYYLLPVFCSLIRSFQFNNYN